MFDVYKIRKDFPMFNNNIKMQGHPLVFLDNASTTFKPYSVIKAIEDYYSFETSNSHRGDYDLCFNIDNKVKEVRHKIAEFVNAEDNEIVFTSGDSMSINMIAYGYGAKYLHEGDEILISEAEHASNVLPWFKIAELTKAEIKYIPLTEDGRIIPDNVKKVITSKTKIIAIAHVGNVLGYVCDIKEIAKIAHDNGAIICVDGAQSVPHMKTDFKGWDIDFLAFSGHKMCGPTGIGVMVGKYELLKITDPLLSGGGMNQKFHLCGDVIYSLPPSKLEAGTMNIAGILGLGAAVDYLNNIGMENIEKYEKEIKDYAFSKISKLDNVIIYNKNADNAIITFNVKGVFAQDESTLLNSKGIATRSGQHCAKILNDFLKTAATVRASFYFYTTKEEIDVFVNALENGGDILDAYFN